jgi:hypothetical protein
MAVLLDHIFLALANGTLSAKTNIEWGLVLRVLDEGHGKVDASDRFQ